MRFIEKLTLIIYSNIMLVVAVVASAMVFGWIDVDIVLNILRTIIVEEPASKIVLGCSIVSILLSIRCIFFDPTSAQRERDRQGVLLANDNGRLMISKETIENLVEAVTKRYPGTKDVASRVELDKDKNVTIFVNSVVSSDTIIKDLTAELQNKVKQKVKETTDLDVKEVNITVKKAVSVEK